MANSKKENVRIKKILRSRFGNIYDSSPEIIAGIKNDVKLKRKAALAR